MGQPPELRVTRTDGTVDVFRETVLLVSTRDDKGRPRLLTNIPEDNTVEMADGAEFVTAWLFDRTEDG
ncbi:MAG: hypothetical protein ACPGVG_15770 [Mycobacterium sp.]